jgi:hypothetical protein
MKKKILFGIGIMAMVVMILFNVSLFSKSIGGDLNLTSLVKIAKADVELPPVEIICSAGDSGRCFYLDWVFCQPGSEKLITYDCFWSGLQADSCNKLVCWLCNVICV